jgi:glutamyl-tRNA synthetase
MVRVRFAPAPTGYLHIGGARTALFNWLYARSQKGRFILRIEDTDINRSRPEYIDEILGSLKWLGLDWDELHYQSKRMNIYRDYADKALEKGHAYNEGKAVIFKIMPKIIKINDLIHGQIEFDTSVIKDQVLIKSDGMPAYNFACVIDDALLEITHIIRGDDHISNTPKQIMLYDAFGFKIPKFAHIPLIMSEQGTRMSKRTGATPISEYKTAGYLPEALVNYLLLLGWSPGGNQEIVSLEKAINKFSIKRVNKTKAAFSIDKLNWINSQYIKKSDTETLVNLLVPLLKERNLIKEDFDRNWLIGVVKLFQGRISTLNEFIQWADFCFLDEPKFDVQAEEKYLSEDLTNEFSSLVRRLDALENFNAQNLESAFRGLVADLGIKASRLVHPVRVALTGRAVGPGLFETMAILGKDRVINRLNQVIKKWH